MADLPQQLRQIGNLCDSPLMVDGADEIDALRKEIERLRKGIQDYIEGGAPDRGIRHKVETCRHGKFGWEACEACIDAYFEALLRDAEP